MTDIITLADESAIKRAQRACRSAPHGGKRAAMRRLRAAIHEALARDVGALRRRGMRR